MNIEPKHPDFKLPTRSTELAGGFDIFMPEEGEDLPVFDKEDHNPPTKVPLGFAAEVPEGHVALLLPRSGVGAKKGVELENTAGVIDADYRGEWVAFINTKNGLGFSWEKHQKVLQFLIVPVSTPELKVVESVSKTERGEGGFGSTGDK